MLRFVATLTVFSLFAAGPGVAHTAPDAPQYLPGTTNIPNTNLLPQGSTTGAALNGNTQLSVPLGGNAYGFGQNASTPPSPGQPAGVGGVVGVGTTFK